jgi:hypothetical protein
MGIWWFDVARASYFSSNFFFSSIELDGTHNLWHAIEISYHYTNLVIFLVVIIWCQAFLIIGLHF